MIRLSKSIEKHVVRTANSIGIKQQQTRCMSKASSDLMPGYFSVFPVPASWKAADVELTAFSEISEALEAMHQGRYKNAAPLIARAREICSSYVGPNGDLTQAISRLQISLSDVMGDFDTATTAFKHLRDIDDASDWEIFLVSQAEYRMHLHNGDASNALQCASRVLDASIRLENSGSSPLSLPMRMAGLESIGVCQMLMGETDGANQRFQEANEISSSIPGSDDLLEQSIVSYVRSSCLRNTGAFEYYINRDMEAARSLWEQAYGPGYSSVANGDFDAVIAEVTEQSSKPCSSLITLNKCGSLNNIGMVFVKQAKYEDATAVLGAAMKLSESLPDDGLKLPESVLKSFNFGRTLRLLAQVYHSNDQAVTSEGLYRSCIRQYELMPGSPRPMYEYQMANAKSGYGRLLAKWDKREREAAALEEESVLLYDKVDGRFSQFEITLSSIFSCPGWSL